MRLIEAIIQANHHVVEGGAPASIPVADFAEALPLVALTCIDARLNPLLPNVLGLPEEHFVWLRNAGNIITGPMSSTLRSLALACAVKGGREIAIIGHTDCQVRRTPILELTERFKALGIERTQLPDNLQEFFGLFASERQNVMRGVEIVRSSPLIGSGVPVHGLLVDLQNGGVEWVVNGYDAMSSVASKFKTAIEQASPEAGKPFEPLSEFKIGDIKFPKSKIGEADADLQNWLAQVKTMEASPAPQPAPEATKPPPQVPPRIEDSRSSHSVPKRRPGNRPFRKR